MFKIAQDLKISQLRAFVTISKEGSFQLASEELNKSQPAISLMIKALESNLGQGLFEKGSHGKLTTFGHYFLRYAKQLVVQHDEIKSRIEEGFNKDNLSVSIACLPSVAQRLLPRYIRGFSDKYPQAHIHIRDASSNDIERLVNAQQVDIAICAIKEIVGNFSLKHIAQDKMGLVCHRSHALAQHKSIAWSALLKHKMIANGTWSLLPLRQHELLMSCSYMNVSNMSSLNAILEANLGGTILPELAYNEASNLAFVPLKSPTVYRQVVLLKNKNKALSMMAERFFNYISEVA